ncbi:MAG: glycosyltransferase family 2 protein [Acidobacteria bacterium]|nr:MAG: glycosyltransferase family 2 protein [Acidobacteriota bacterium]
MRTLAEPRPLRPTDSTITLPITVVIAARNEAHNLPRCLESLRGVGEVYVVDSNSSDETAEIARSLGATVIQFTWQWAMDNLPITYDWILLLDADEALTPELSEEIGQAIRNPGFDGYYISLQMFFLGRALRHGDASFCKMSLFRRGHGHFECRLEDQDTSMCDMEVHEHVVVSGRTARLRNSLSHRNCDSLSRYIRKHDAYSNWEARVWLEGESSELPPSLFATQTQRRRWLKKKLFGVPGSPVLFFLYKYFLRLGILDGRPGLIYCALQSIQFFHIKAKIYEGRTSKA